MSAGTLGNFIRSENKSEIGYPTLHPQKRGSKNPILLTRVRVGIKIKAKSVNIHTTYIII